MVDLISDLSVDSWKDKGNPPNDPSKISNYKPFTLFQRHVPEGDHMTYFLKTDDGSPLEVILDGLAGERDPLKDVHNCYLQLGDRDGKVFINGIILDRDWVERK